MATSEQKELEINQHLDMLDDMMEDGPADDDTPEHFLRSIQDLGRKLIGTLETLTVSDVDEIWPEGESE